MKKYFLLLVFIGCVYCAKAQMNTYNMAGQLASLERTVQKGDSMTLAVLRKERFSALAAMLNNETRWAMSSFKLADDEVQVFTKTTAVAKTLYIRTRGDKKLRDELTKSKVLQPLMGNINALLDNKIAIDSVAAEVSRVEQQLSTAKKLSVTTESVVKASASPVQLLSNAVLGIPSQSQLILGAAAFLAERFKSELEEAYLNKMQTNLNQSALRYVFPHTKSMLNFHVVANGQQFGTLLKTSFEQDLAALPDNFVNALDAPDGFQKFITNDTLREVMRYGKATHLLLKQVKKGNDPTDIIETLANQFADFEHHDFDKVVTVTHLLTKNLLVSTTDGQAWLNPKQLKNPDTLKYFLLLTYQQNQPLFVSLGASPEVMQAEYTTYFPIIRNTLSSLNRVEGYIQQFNTKNQFGTISKDSLGMRYRNYLQYVNDVVSQGFDYYKNDKTKTKSQGYLRVADRVLETHQAVEQRQYGLALNNVVYMLDYLCPDKRNDADFKALMGKLVLYGSFMLDMSNAQDEVAVKRILNNYAMPVGSYALKRKSNWNVGIQAYVGAFGGGEYLNAPNVSNKFAANVAFAAPIGIDVSHGLPNNSSLSVFMSVVDLGAVVSYRLGDPNTRSLPELKLANVLAPGFQLMYGLRNSPIAIGAGIQMAPPLRKYSTDDAVINSDIGIRAGISATVDIPIFSIYNK